MNEFSSRHSIFSKPLIAGWIGMGTSVIGDAFLEYTLVVYAAHSKEGLSLGVIGFVIAIAAYFGGYVGSHLDVKRDSWGVLILCALVASSIVSGILAASWNSSFFSTLAYVIVFALALFGLVVTTIWQSALPEFADSNVDIAKRVIGWSTSVITAGAAFGPLLAALLSVHIAARELLYFDSASFLFCAILLVPSAIVITSLHRSTSKSSEFGPKQKRPSALEGLKLIFAEPLVRSPGICAALMNFVTYGVVFLVPSLVVQRHFANAVIALASTCVLIGGLAGSSVATHFRSDRYFVAFAAIEPAVRGIALVAVAFSQSVIVLLISLLLFAVPQGMGSVARAGFLVSSFPGTQRGRVIGSWRMLLRCLMPFGPIVLQEIARATTLKVTLLVSALLLFFAAIGIFFDPSLRHAWRLKLVSRV